LRACRGVFPIGLPGGSAVTYGVLIGAVFISYLLYFNEEHWQLIGNVLMMLIIFSVFQVTSYSIPYTWK
jgi:hypothetical protein